MYREKLDEIMYGVNNKAISTKILERMDQIRNNDDEGQARRFVWELIQNAKDVAQENVPLKIRMTLDNSRFVFAHNGKNFRMKNLLSLINQVSGKNPDEGTTGKFGTGFITTHLLAEKVLVRGILEDFDYPAKPFEVLLDRSGRTDESIIAAVDKAMDSVRTIDDNDSLTVSADALNTEFEYVLESDYNRKVADTGVNDACCNLFYSMTFVPSIHEIELVDNTKGVRTVYTRGNCENINDTISRLTITENGLEHTIIISSNGTVQVVSEIDGELKAIPMSEKTSRLFCDFPLIDNMLFPFPTAVNSSGFRVNEPRSCITLTDNPNSSDSETNKKLMKQAVSLYGSLLEYLEGINCKQLYNIINVPPVFKRSDLSESWINENLIKGVASEVAKRRILPANDGLFSANDYKLILPHAESAELNIALNELLSEMPYFKTVSEDIESWSNALRSLNDSRFPTSTIKSLVEEVSTAKNLSEVQRNYSPEPYKWLKKLFDCATKVSTLESDIYSGKYSIIPNQSEKLIPITDAYAEEEEIDIYYKNICFDIDLYCSERLHLKDILISKDYDTSGMEKIRPFDVAKIGSHIRMGTRTEYTQRYFQAEKVVKMMGACCSDDRTYRTYKGLIPDIPERYAPKLKLYEDVWSNAHTKLTGLCESKLYDLAKISNGYELLKAKYSDEEEAIDSLNCVHELWEKYKQPSQYSLPVLAEKDDGTLTLINISPNSTSVVINDGIDDRLREIYRRIVTDGALIIDKRNIVGRGFFIKSMDELRAASLIGNKITAELKEGALFNKPKEFQAACSLLMRWINSNEEKATKLFPAYASKEDRMQLMAPGEAAEMSEQLDEFNSLLTEAGCASIEELKKKLKNDKKTDDSDENEDNCSSNGLFEIYGDFGYDPLKNNLEEIRERIGEKGEELAFELLKKKYGENAVTLCNTQDSKQQGYDIIVKTPEGELLYEVKTHTETSMYRYHLKFSKSQSRMLKKPNYRVLLIILNRSWNLSESREFNDLFDDFNIGCFDRNDGYRVYAGV